MSQDIVKITVKVEPEDISKGQRYNPVACPLALAISKHLKENLRSVVSVESIAIQSIPNFEIMYSLKTPQNLITYMRRFDTGRKVGPFTFDIELPSEFVKFEDIFLRRDWGRFVLDHDCNPEDENAFLYGYFEFNHSGRKYILYLSTLIDMLSPLELRALKNRIEGSEAYQVLERYGIVD